MFKTILHTFLLLLLALPLSGQVIQSTSNIWYFGDRAGLDFNSFPPTALIDGQLNTQEGVATISNDNGELLFYTDGITVWDRTHQPMPNANGTLNGHPSSTQSAIIIPNINNPGLYYIFTTDELGNSNGLSYTSIDMTSAGNGTSNSPLGNVNTNELNVQLANPVTEKLTGVLKSDCSGYWVIAHGWNNNRFYVYDVTFGGVNPNPIISNIGNIHAGGTGNINSVGCMKATIDGQKLALVNRNNGTVDMYDFDSNNGTVSNEVEITTNSASLYGIEFSPSGNYLYVGGTNNMSRYSISSGIVTNVPIDDTSPFGNNNGIRALQLGPDENIYVSIRNWDYISIIYNPDGNNPSLTTSEVFLDTDGAGRNCRFGLPNIFYFGFSPEVTGNVIMTACPGGSVEFNNETYPAPSVNEVNYIDANGCSYIVVLTVEIAESYNEDLLVAACEGSYYDYNGTQILAGTSEEFTYSTNNSCDSIVTVIVSISEILEENIFVTACEDDFYIFEGVAVAAGTNEQISTIDQDGCPLLINLFVEALAPDQTQLNFTNCGDTTFTYLGIEIEIGNDTSFLFQNQNGCDSILTVQVIENVEEVSIIEEFLCDGEFYTFNDMEYPIGTDTIFYFIDQNGCDSIILLKILMSPDVDFILATEASCWNFDDGSISVQGVIGGISPYEFSYDGLNFLSTPNVENLAPGVYQILVRDANLCVFEQEIEILEIPEISIDYNEAILSCDEDSTLIIVDLLSGDPADVIWNWPNGSNTNYSFISQPGTYSLEVSNQCQTLVENIRVQIEAGRKEDYIYIPNVFSPNDDGYNDVFQLYPADEVAVLSFEIQIFNRWGALLFESTDINFSWDGAFKDDELNPGVYVWWVKANVFACHREIWTFRKGDITIVR
ncbi:MAG: gliding motility-associated-like protein [Saprospiraceae bacterium]|jgi:gliding motility-associated-like protein